MKRITAARLMLCALLAIALVACSNRADDTPLNANVANLGMAFTIQNNDSFAWENCDLELNSEYAIKGINIAAGAVFPTDARDFVTSGGIHFNPNIAKAQTLYIHCRKAPSGIRSSLVSWK